MHTAQKGQDYISDKMKVIRIWMIAEAIIRMDCLGSECEVIW